MRTEFTFHTDAGHGWLEATVGECRVLGILDKISRYSYRQGSQVFLEEDCDAPLFVEALKTKGVTAKFIDVYEDNSFIRNLPRFWY